MADFAQELARRGRVSIRGGNMALRAHLLPRIRGLRDIVSQLDHELGVSVPPIEVVPECWHQSLGDGSAGFAHASVFPVERDSVRVFSVRMSGASLAAFDDDLIQGIIAHEFLHYVWDTITFGSKVSEGSGTMDLMVHEYETTFDSRRERDVLLQVDPDEWLSPRLIRLCRRAEDSKDPAVDTAMEALVRWYEDGLPATTVSTGYATRGRFCLDDRVVAKAREIACRA